MAAISSSAAAAPVARCEPSAGRGERPPPAAAPERSGAKIEKVQGFNIRRWNADGLEFWAVSDIDAEELQEFGTKFEAGLHEVGRT